MIGSKPSTRAAHPNLGYLGIHDQTVGWGIGAPIFVEDRYSNDDLKNGGWLKEHVTTMLVGGLYNTLNK